MDKKVIKSKSVISLGLLAASIPVNAQYSPTPEFTGHLERDLENSLAAYPQHNPKAKEGAPNVVWILIDDIGYGATSAFGGLIQTPTFNYLANNGLRYTNFHTTPLSAPTRASLLTGRNSHSVHVGKFNNDTYGAPGYDTYMPLEDANIAEILRENGYATFAIGKFNFTPTVNGTNAGPFNRWPTNRGFDHYFGYHPASALDDQWHPSLYRDTQREPDDSVGKMAMTRFADQAIQFIADQKTAAPDQPFFLYLAPGTAHEPHHASKEWISKYKGKFDAGWNEYAKQVLENQIRLGVVPKDTKLPIPNEGVDKWKDLTADEKKVFARQMEVYAGYVSQADYEIGRVVDYLREIGQLDNTIIVAAIGDNGAASGGQDTGVWETTGTRGPRKDYIAKELANLSDLGSERSYPSYAEGWSAATNTPFRYYKSYADYEGGTHNSLIVYYPKVIKKSGIRSQFVYVTDVLPTTIELTDSKVPSVVNGYKQNPIEGVSFGYTIKDDAEKEADQHTLQYIELQGSGAIYKDGWKATFPSKYPIMFHHNRDTKAHLYHISEDFNEAVDLAEKYPEKLKELLDVFDTEAKKYNVYPLKPGSVPYDLIKGEKPEPKRTHYDILFGPRNYAEYPYLELPRGKSFVLSSEIDVPQSDANGTLFSHSDFTFYLKSGKPVYIYRTPLKTIRLDGNVSVNIGKNVIKADVTINAEKHSIVTLYVNGKEAGSKDFGPIFLGNFTAFSGPIFQIGRTWGVSITDDYKSPYLLSGKYLKATIDIK